MDWRNTTMTKYFSFHKKAQIDEGWIFLFYRFVIVCLVAIAMVILVKMYIVTEIDVQQTQVDLFVTNMLNMKQGVSYYDETLQRAYPGIVLRSDFENPSALETRLDQQMDYGEYDILAAELTLFDAEKNTIGTAVYNQEWYDRWIVLAQTFWSGKGSSTDYLVNKTVLIKDDDALSQGVLQFHVVMPNS